jgi:hypothetical protein
MHISIQRENQGVMDLSTKATYAGSGFAAIWGILTVEQWIGIAGILVAVIGLSIRTYFDWLENGRKRERHELHKLEVQARLDAGAFFEKESSGE